MIRLAKPEDAAAIGVVIAAGMFTDDDAWFLEGTLEDYFGCKRDEGHRGYEEEARNRDYWTAGDDLVVFRKGLLPEA